MSKEEKEMVIFCACGCGGWWSVCTKTRYDIDADIRADYAEMVAEGGRLVEMPKSEIPFNLMGCQVEGNPSLQLKLF